jgi:5-methylcytosine-specific restriction enzyme A
MPSKRREADRRYSQKRRDHPDQAFLRTRDWRDKIRRAQLSEHPLCRDCLAIGRVTMAREVDHIVVPNGDPTLQRDMNNPQSLCKEHHAAKTRHQGKKGPRSLGIDPKTGYPAYGDDGGVT